MLVAVSGGPDSVALLHVLNDVRDEFRLELGVAHLQHGMRGGEAKEDARFVEQLAEKLEIPFHLKEINLAQMKSSAGKGNLEALARAERYRFFAEVVRERGLGKVATAHTQDDQAETVLMWFLRGAGVKGLGGMAPRHQFDIGGGDSTVLTVIRPFLEVSKAEVLQYLAERRLSFRVDRSNLDTALLRNWIRLELLPLIGRRAGTRVAARLSQQAELCREEDALLDDLARRRYGSMLDAGGLARRVFLAEPRALQRRVLRLWIERTRGHLRGLEFVHIEEILRLILEGTPQRRASIPGGWELVREYDTLKLVKRFRTAHRVCYNYRLEIGRVLAIPEAGLELHSERVSAPPRRLPDDLMEAVFDVATVTEPLSVRNFRRGDRFQPLGMSGHKKVKDLFIEKRVPLSVRAHWPILASGDEVLWIPRYGRSAAGRVSKKTTSILHLKAQWIAS
ncbi:MAG: tRNA lysidine(34) synthetase TilS [Candidatus Binatia bacterium]